MSYKNQIIEKILIEWAYRVDNGMPNPKNKEHISILSEVLSDLGLSEIKNEFIQILLNEDKADEVDRLKATFANPVLNKIVTYKNKDGKEQKGLVGNLLSNPKDNPGRIAAEKLLPDEGTPERDKINKELGGDDKSQQLPSEKSADGEPQTQKPQGSSLNPNTSDGKSYIDSLPDEDPAKPKQKEEDKPEPSTKISGNVYGVAGESDTDIKNDMLKYGFNSYEKKTGRKPAPGSAGSAFNEIASGQGVHMLDENPNMGEEELARKMYNQYKDTELGKEQSKSSGVGKIPSDIENGDLYSKCVLAARSAKTKYNNSVNRVNDLQSKGKFGTIDKIDTYYGAAESIQAQTLAIRDAKKVMLPNGTEVDKDDAVAFVKAGGGGMNPSDTATFVKDSDGNLLIQFHSDKTATSDIQDNSTLAQEGVNYKKSIDESNLSDSQKEKAKSLVGEYSSKISKIEDNYNNQAIPIAGRLAELPIQQQMDVIEKETGTLKKNIDAAIFGAGGKIKSQYKNYLPLDKNPEDLTTEEKYTMIRRLVADGKGKGDDVKVINKVGLGLQKVDPTIDGIDVKSNLSKQREQVVSLQRERIEELNKQGFMDIDGVSVPIGRAMEADETVRGFHLHLMDYPPKGYEKGKPSSMISSLDINMGGTVVNGDVMRSCFGVNNTTEFKQKFRLKEAEETTKDKEGNVTGKTVYVYAIDSEGKQTEIGRKVYRSKAGATGKTQNTMVYSTQMQNCFKSK
jgi:hypothetical protein